jgi:hypothetical protein
MIFFLIVIIPFGYTSYSLIKNYDIQLSKNIEFEQAEEGDMETSLIEKSYEAKEHDDDIEKQEEQKSKDLKSHILIIGVGLIGLGIVGIIISIRKKKIKKFRKL